MACQYCASADLAFDSVIYIMRDVNYGWFIRSTHCNGASAFFRLRICSYCARNFLPFFFFKAYVMGRMFYIIVAYRGCFFWVCASLGADILLGSNCDFEFSVCYSCCRNEVSRVGLRRVQCWGCNFKTVICFSFLKPFHFSCLDHGPHLLPT